MQLQYNIGPVAATPGMRHGSTMTGDDIISVIAGTIIPFGVFCEFNPTTGLLQPIQDTGTVGSFLPIWAGVSLYDPLTEQSYVPYTVPPSVVGGSVALGYPKGYAVPVMRRGRIWCQFDGVLTSITKYPLDGTFNVWHSSDGTHLQGVLTGAAVSATAGAEIDVLPTSGTAAAKTFDLLGQAGLYTNIFGTTFGVGAMTVDFK
jgi:hypothetical protein